MFGVEDDFYEMGLSEGKIKGYVIGGAIAFVIGIVFGFFIGVLV